MTRDPYLHWLHTIEAKEESQRKEMISDREQLKRELKAELMKEIMADPSNVLLGIPLPELSRIIYENRERKHRVSPYDLEGQRRAIIKKS